MTARANLRPVLGSRVSFAQVSLPDLPFAGWADLVFSTATFHWIKDHPALFAGILRALRPGGRLHAQCGGGPNLRRTHELAEQVMHADPFTPFFGEWPGPWEFANAELTADRLKTAGFVDVETNLEAAPTMLASEADYREFVTTVIYHPHLARLLQRRKQARRFFGPAQTAYPSHTALFHSRSRAACVRRGVRSR